MQDVVDRSGTAAGEPGDQASDLGEAEVDERGGSVSALSASSWRARRTVRQAWAAMASVMWRCQPGKAADLVVVQAALLLGGPEAFLHGPAAAGDADQLVQRGANRASSSGSSSSVMSG